MKKRLCEIFNLFMQHFLSLVTLDEIAHVFTLTCATLILDMSFMYFLSTPALRRKTSLRFYSNFISMRISLNYYKVSVHTAASCWTRDTWDLISSTKPSWPLILALISTSSTAVSIVSDILWICNTQWWSVIALFLLCWSSWTLDGL